MKMETNVTSARTLIEAIDGSGIQAAVLVGGGIIRHGYGSPYANPPVSNYRKFWYSNGAAFWSAFRVYPGDGSVVNQLGSNPVTQPATAFQEVGFGYTFIAEATTNYSFNVTFQAGPITSIGARNSIELELLGSNVRPVPCVLGGPLNATLTLDAYLNVGVQYTLLFKTKVEIAMAPGEAGKYGEVIARFPSILASYVVPWGMGAAPVQAAHAESPDLERALKALQADGNGGEILLQPVSYKDIAQAGAAGFGGFSDSK
jgi:hypothetical protein